MTKYNCVEKLNGEKLIENLKYLDLREVKNQKKSQQQKTPSYYNEHPSYLIPLFRLELRGAAVYPSQRREIGRIPWRNLQIAFSRQVNHTQGVDDI